MSVGSEGVGSGLHNVYGMRVLGWEAGRETSEDVMIIILMSSTHNITTTVVMIISAQVKNQNPVLVF